MTQEELSKLTPEEKQLAIAEKCGWYDFGTTAPERGSLTPRIIGRNKLSMDRRLIPDYLNDRNAMAEAEKIVENNDEYLIQLLRIVETARGYDWTKMQGVDGCRCCAFATAAQRADTFLLVVC